MYINIYQYLFEFWRHTHIRNTEHILHHRKLWLMFRDERTSMKTEIQRRNLLNLLQELEEAS